MEGMKIGQIQGKVIRGRLILNPTIKSTSTYIPNMTILAGMAHEKFLKKILILQSWQG